LFAIETPMVPMLRTCRSPMPPARRASAGIARRTSSEAATSAWRMVAPMIRASLSRRMPAQFGERAQVDHGAGLRQAQLHGADQLLWPPASGRPPVSFSSCSAAYSVAGRS